MKKRMLVNAPDGEQCVHLVGPGGSYFDPSRVLWNEHVDGDLNESVLSSLGGVVRSGNALSVDAGLLAAAQARAATRASNASAKVQRVNQAKQALNNALLANTDPDLTPLQIRQLFRSIRVILKDVSNQLD